MEGAKNLPTRSTITGLTDATQATDETRIVGTAHRTDASSLEEQIEALQFDDDSEPGPISSDAGAKEFDARNEREVLEHDENETKNPSTGSKDANENASVSSQMKVKDDTTKNQAVTDSAPVSVISDLNDDTKRAIDKYIADSFEAQCKLIVDSEVETIKAEAKTVAQEIATKTVNKMLESITEEMNELRTGQELLNDSIEALLTAKRDHEAQINAIGDSNNQSAIVDKKVDEAFGKAWENGSLSNVCKATLRELLTDEDFVKIIGGSFVKNPSVRPHVMSMVAQITKLVSKAKVEEFVNTSTKEIRQCQDEINEWSDMFAANHDRLEELLLFHQQHKAQATPVVPVGAPAPGGSPPPSDNESERRHKKKKNDKKTKASKKKKNSKKKNDSDIDASNFTDTQNSDNDSDQSASDVEGVNASVDFHRIQRQHEASLGTRCPMTDRFQRVCNWRTYRLRDRSPVYSESGAQKARKCSKDFKRYIGSNFDGSNPTGIIYFLNRFVITCNQFKINEGNAAWILADYLGGSAQDLYRGAIRDDRVRRREDLYRNIHPLGGSTT